MFPDLNLGESGKEKKIAQKKRRARNEPREILWHK